MSIHCTKNENRFLRKFVCKWCEQRLDRDCCGDIFGPSCSASDRDKRRKSCLELYQPRGKQKTPAWTDEDLAGVRVVKEPEKP